MHLKAQVKYILYILTNKMH